MAKRKTRKRKVSAAPVRVNRAIKTARRRRSRKGGLSEAFKPASAKAAALDMVKAAGGGLANAVIEKGVSMVTTGQTAKIVSTALVIASSFITHAVMKQPAVSGGMIGAEAYKWSKAIPGLNDDDAAFADEDALADEPDFMAEDGTPYYLNEAGELVAMADEYALAEELDEDYV